MDHLQNAISSPLAGWGGVGWGYVEIYKWLIYSNDGWLYKWSLYSECEGKPTRFEEKCGAFHWLLTASAHTSVYNCCIQKRALGQARKHRANVWLYSLTSLTIESPHRECSEVEQLIHKGAVPKVPKAKDPVNWIPQLDYLPAAVRVCAWITATIGCFSV